MGGEARRALLVALALGFLLAQPCRASFFSFRARWASTSQSQVSPLHPPRHGILLSPFFPLTCSRFASSHALRRTSRARRRCP